MTATGYDPAMRCTIVGAGIALFLAQVGVAQTSSTTVEAVQLTVRAKPTIDGVKMFGEPGVELQLAARVPGKPILAVDGDKSRLVRLVDDQGTDLAKGAPTGFFSWISLSNAFRDEPTDTCLLDVKTSTLPAAGAGRLELEAEVALISASGSVTNEQKVKLEKGAKVTCGPVPMTLGSVEKSSFGGSALNVQLSSEQRMDAIKSVVFVDAKGNEIEVQPMGEGSFGFGGKKTYTKSFGLPKKLGEVTVRITSYAKMGTVKLPVKLSIGMGLR
jgi:hypothetical protein